MDGREKRVMTAAGEGWQQGTAAGDESVNNQQQEWRVDNRQQEWGVAGGKEDDGSKSNGESKKGGG